MLKISRTLFDHITEKDFVKFMFIDPEKIHKLSGNFFRRCLNHILPPTNKFLRETFNAVENGKILAQISLIPDNFSNFRWQFSSLKIRSGCEYIAKPLVDFVVSKYGGSGVSTFLAYVDENNDNVISLFKNQCGFRSCAKIDFFRITNLDSFVCDFNEANFKDFEKNDIIEILEINTMNIFPHFRPSLISDLNDFKYEFLKQAKGDYLKVFVVNGTPEGYFRIYTNDKKNFFVDVITSKAYEHCYAEIISYIHSLLKDHRDFLSLTVFLKRYRETSQALEECLVSAGYSFLSTTHILVKDYWQKENQTEEKLFAFFNDLATHGVLNICNTKE